MTTVLVTPVPISSNALAQGVFGLTPRTAQPYAGLPALPESPLRPGTTLDAAADAALRRAGVTPAAVRLKVQLPAIEVPTDSGVRDDAIRVPYLVLTDHNAGIGSGMIWAPLARHSVESRILRRLGQLDVMKRAGVELGRRIDLMDPSTLRALLGQPFGTQHATQHLLGWTSSDELSRPRGLFEALAGVPELRFENGLWYWDDAEAAGQTPVPASPFL